MSRKSKGYNKPKPSKRQQRKRVLEYRASLVNKDGEPVSKRSIKRLKYL